jgi:hypothetical protein
MSTAVITSWIERFCGGKFDSQGFLARLNFMQVLLVKEKSAIAAKHQHFLFHESVDLSQKSKMVLSYENTVAKHLTGLARWPETAQSGAVPRISAPQKLPVTVLR